MLEEYNQLKKYISPRLFFFFLFSLNLYFSIYFNVFQLQCFLLTNFFIFTFLQIIKHYQLVQSYFSFPRFISSYFYLHFYLHFQFFCFHFFFFLIFYHIHHIHFHFHSYFLTRGNSLCLSRGDQHDRSNVSTK